MQRFQQECAFLESVRHPNIVQYLGMTSLGDPESRLPVLLMELLDESLTKMLENSQRSLAYCIQVDICHDIALAVSYLHSNDIIHRDLSSNNVLIMAKSRAKVTDFGMSKLAGAAPSMTLLTMCPGTVAYMPPEALREPPVYTKKLDCFSEGVIMIQVCTRLWPEPGPRTKLVPFPASPTGMTDVPVLEPERRKYHIDMIDPGHGLLPIAVDCIHYQENERPSSEELCQRLAGLKETREYRESIKQVEGVQNDIAQLERQTIQQLQELHIVNQQLQQRYESEIQAKDREIQKLRHNLEEQQQITAEIQQTNTVLQRRVEQLQQQQPQYPPVGLQGNGGQLQQIHSMKEEQPQPSAQQIQYKKRRPPTKIMKIGEWRESDNAPWEMARGAAAIDGNVVYFMNFDGRTCSYDTSAQIWRKLPQYYCCYGSLAMIRGLLTAIGGNKNTAINELACMVSKKWVEHFPPMPTKRFHVAVVSTEEYLIVAGGQNQLGQLDTVEVMDIETLVWSTAASLPYPYSRASATLCGEQLYMLGGFQANDTMTKSVLTCSLPSLLQSCSETSTGLVWHGIADVPVYLSTCTAINGELVAVGGCDREQNSSSAVRKYNPTTDSWDTFSHMDLAARHLSFVAILPTIEIMVAGGETDSVGITDQIEIGWIVLT